MNKTLFETVAQAAVLELDFSSEEFSCFAEDYSFSEDAIDTVQRLFPYRGTVPRENRVFPSDLSGTAQPSLTGVTFVTLIRNHILLTLDKLEICC